MPGSGCKFNIHKFSTVFCVVLSAPQCLQGSYRGTGPSWPVIASDYSNITAYFINPSGKLKLWFNLMWWPMMAHDGPWWPVMARDGPWWPMMAHDGPWWPVMARDGPWWPVMAFAAASAPAIAWKFWSLSTLTLVEMCVFVCAWQPRALCCGRQRQLLLLHEPLLPVQTHTHYVQSQIRSFLFQP